MVTNSPSRPVGSSADRLEGDRDRAVSRLPSTSQASALRCGLAGRWEEMEENRGSILGPGDAETVRAGEAARTANRSRPLSVWGALRAATAAATAAAPAEQPLSSADAGRTDGAAAGLSSPLWAARAAPPCACADAAEGGVEASHGRGPNPCDPTHTRLWPGVAALPSESHGCALCCARMERIARRMAGEMLALSCTVRLGTMLPRSLFRVADWLSGAGSRSRILTKFSND